MFRIIGFLIILGLSISGCAHVDTPPPTPEETPPKDAAESLMPSSDIPDPTEFIAVDELPVQLQEGALEYPEAAKKAHISGVVIVQVYVGTDGKVLKVHALKCSHPGMGFEDAAIKAAFEGLWRPAKTKGKPVGVWVAYTVKFADQSFEGIH